MHVIRKQFEFEAGHRIQNHQGKCKRPHGHSYLVEVAIGAERLNDLGMVADFKVLNDSIGKWIDDNLDHKMILQATDPLAGQLQDTDLYLMDRPPTAEELAKLIAHLTDILLKQCGVVKDTPEGPFVIGAAVWETSTSSAQYFMPNIQTEAIKRCNVQ